MSSTTATPGITPSPAHAAGRARRERHAVFLRLLASLPAPLRVLDVGGTFAYWQTVGLPGQDVSIELLNLCVEPVRGQFTSVAGDARDLSRYGDHSFDIVFSNSVIGHVGARDDQIRMAREIRRVGRHYFVQTPNHGFPLDWRTLVPLFHFLPPHTQAWCFEHLAVGSYRRALNESEALDWATRVRNVRRSDLPVLFPHAQLLVERRFGLVKSFMLHNFPPSPSPRPGRP